MFLNNLKFDKKFKKNGKQGVVGLMKDDDNNKYVFKFSQYFDYLAKHEFIISQSLKEISSFCPNFCKPVGFTQKDVDAKYKKKTEPFNISKKRQPVNKDVLLLEYINTETKFYDFIQNDDIPEKVLYSILKQILLAILVAQKQKKFTHYDLHSDNILIKKCSPDDCVLYVIDEEHKYLVHTNGFIPVIIDYGFSYIQDLENKPLWSSLAHTQVGFSSNTFDPYSDPKLLLVTVSDEIKETRKTKNSKILRRIVKNMFYKLDIDWSSGWDTDKKYSITEYMLKNIDELEDKHESVVFSEFSHYALDLIQSLIILPLDKQEYKDYKTSYLSFVKEWYKIEKIVSNPFYCIYILKQIIDKARLIRPYYLNNKYRKKAVSHFKKDVLDIVSKIKKFVSLKDINFEIMLCSLFVFSKCAEGLLYEKFKKFSKLKKKSYKRLPFENLEEIYEIIDYNIPQEYIYNENSSIIILDSQKKESDYLEIDPIIIKKINDADDMDKGELVHDIYNTKKKKIMRSNELRKNLEKYIKDF